MKLSPHTETGKSKLSITFRLYKVGKYNINVDQKSFVNTGRLTKGKKAKEQNYIQVKIGVCEFLGKLTSFHTRKVCRGSVF